ncbi:MAG TPA: ABC transporter ATP-binding protein [Polyangiaceae bacterium]|nr:ABC transporter ATP-binding protein [Polyangiaceae bacterium]
MSASVLNVRALEKTFRIGFFRKRVDAVRGIDFEVREGEIFGLLGPNGAGKTTTIKMVLRLIFPSGGTIELFGDRRGLPSTMKRVGYLPENPYVYQYLRPMEFLDLCGRLVGMDGATRAKRGREMIERVGLAHAIERPIGKFSKGMMQRMGLAQALLHEPPLLILDEPMSGLDPIGRKEVRELIIEHRNLGTTILFTSHILSDVELLCDRVGILRSGKMTHYGQLDQLLRPETRRAEVVLTDVSESLLAQLKSIVEKATVVDGKVTLDVTGSDGPDPVVKHAVQGGARVVSVTAARETLESLFVRDALDAQEQLSEGTAEATDEDD